MLTEILRMIYETRVYSKSKISKELDIGEDMVEQGVLQLINMGYIKEDEMSMSCEGSCSGCAVTNCNIDRIQTYTITEKGMDIIED